MSDFYVYTHSRETTGEVFYVGKGRKNRAWNFRGRNQHWNRVNAKHGCVVTLVAVGLAEPCAFSLEKILIAKFGRRNLANSTDGGEGTAGLVLSEAHKRAVAEANARRVISEETRAKLVARHKGHVKSEETRRKLSASLTGRVKSDQHKEKLRQANLGKTHSPESKAKMTASRLGMKRGPFSDAHRARISEARTDQAEHTLQHDTYGLLTAKRSHFMNTYGMDTAAFSRVLSGKNKSHKGWRLPDA